MRHLYPADPSFRGVCQRTESGYAAAVSDTDLRGWRGHLFPGSEKADAGAHSAFPQRGSGSEALLCTDLYAG